MIEHRDVLGDANRILRRQHEAELPDADPFGLHRQVEVEHDRVGRDLEALDVEVVLGEADRVVAQRVARLGELAEVGQHLLVQLRTQPRHALLDVRARADRRKEEERDLHLTAPVSVCYGRVARKSSTARLKSAGLSMLAA